jgi:hypothetical protein
MPSEPYDASKPLGHAIFASTRWSVVLAARGRSPQAAEALESAISGRLASRRVPVLLMSAFGALSLLLASVGVYGMLPA